MRTPTGDYRIDYHDKYGERIPGASENAKCFTQAQSLAKAYQAENEIAASYMIMRCIYNSLDKSQHE